MIFILQDAVEQSETYTEGMTNPLVADSMSIMDLLVKGGWVMGVLVVLLFVATYLFTERILYIRKAKVSPHILLGQVKEAIVKEVDAQKAQRLCESENTPMSKLILTGLHHIGDSTENIKGAIENTGKLEVYEMEKNLSILGTISGAAPMIGFLGTVIGMIKAFLAMANLEGAVSAKDLSAGISEAMITTAGGLCVGIVAYVAYNYLIRQVSAVVNSMEITSIEFFDMLREVS